MATVATTAKWWMTTGRQSPSGDGGYNDFRSHRCQAVDSRRELTQHIHRLATVATVGALRPPPSGDGGYDETWESPKRLAPQASEQTIDAV